MHQGLKVVYIYLKFQEIRLRGYLVIANYSTDFKSIQRLQLMNYQGQPDQTLRATHYYSDTYLE